ncbi:MAG: hypothetical protein K6G61_09815 [Solobacterium sp.]|nr:hypothetical protein [Solobacterium sp.]
MNKTNREYKSRLFSKYFSDPANRKHLLSLYNAVNHTTYTDEKKIRINTIRTVLYHGFHNDLSFLFGSTMNLYEHQSTVSQNMPFRDLLYSSHVYGPYAEKHRRQIYGSALLRIPRPQYCVFYNGQQDMPEIWESRLSEAYESAGDVTAEIVVTHFNINWGKGYRILEDCPALKGYAWFVERTRVKMKDGKTSEEAVREAILEMPDEYEIKEYLKKLKEEQMLSLFEEFDDEAYIAAVREDGRNEGRAEGKEEGRSEERNKYIHRICRMFTSEGMPASAAAARTAQLLGLQISDVNQVLGNIPNA